MRKLAERLLIFFIGVPAVFALVYLLPFYKHLPLNVIITLFSAIGAVEFSAMLEKKQISITKTEAFILGALAPAAATLNISLNIPLWIVPVILAAGALWAILSRVFSSNANMGNVIGSIAGSLSALIYPGFFMYWLVQMSLWDNSGAILLFLFIIFGSDSLAWLTGSLFGANNRGVIAASPNKSIAGFAGGLFGALAVSCGTAILFPSIFHFSGFTAAFITKAMALGLCTGIFAALGDLAESAIKRSCNIKDSGNIMLGRGGILDSIDSIAVAAPVFFLFFKILFFGF
jgi:phosphatidate cytidylyltransferase